MNIVPVSLLSILIRLDQSISIQQLSFKLQKMKKMNVSFNPLQPGIAFLYPLMFQGGIEKQHQPVMS